MEEFCRKRNCALKFWISFCITFIQLCSVCLGSNGTSSRNASELQRLLTELENSGYEHRLPPSHGTGNTTLVEMDIYILDIEYVEETRMEYAISIYFRQKWSDTRLVTALSAAGIRDRITTHHFLVGNIWQPDGFFVNGRKGFLHTISQPNMLMRIYPNGDIYFSQRLTVQLTCSMDLMNFPMDVQVCPVKLESYAFLTDEVKFRWMESMNNSDSEQVNPDLILPNFAIGGMLFGDCSATYITGTFTCLYANIKLKRLFGYYLTSVYVPSIMIVALSWTAFWVDASSAPARVCLAALSVLTITTQSSQANQSLPKVSYVKSLDVWMSVCLCFAFATLVEYAIVNTLASLEANDKKKMEKELGVEKGREVDYSNGTNGQLKTFANHGYVPNQDETQVNINSISTKVRMQNQRQLTRTSLYDCEAGMTLSRTPSRDTRPTRRRCVTSKQVDRIAKFLFPTAFIVFNVVYWFIYVPHIF